MLVSCLIILFSLGILFVGAEGLIRGSSAIAARVGISRLVVGLTVVAFGTSSPEMVVSVKAAWIGDGDIALGNVLGSNSFNIAIILGLTALICPIPVHLQIIRFDAPIALLVALALPLLLLDGVLGRIDGSLLFLGIVIYTLVNLRMARRESPSVVEAAIGAPAADGPPASPRHRALDFGMIVFGLVFLVWGANLLVTHSVAIARELGVDDAVIGLTIVAAGTSLPELVTSIIAALKKQSDIAIGNVVGSNVFNILGILGCSSIIAPLQGGGIRTLDYIAVIVFTLLLLPLMFTGRKLIRTEGAILVAMYGAYLWMLWPA